MLETAKKNSCTYVLKNAYWCVIASCDSIINAAALFIMPYEFSDILLNELI